MIHSNVFQKNTWWATFTSMIGGGVESVRNSARCKGGKANSLNEALISQVGKHGNQSFGTLTALSSHLL